MLERARTAMPGIARQPRGRAAGSSGTELTKENHDGLRSACGRRSGKI